MRYLRSSFARRLAILFVAACTGAPVQSAEPVVIRFDFSKSALAFEVSVRGTTLFVLLDTGVNPSVINLTRADALGLKVDRHDGGEASGFGGGKGATIFPTRIDRLAIGGTTYRSFDALATDTSVISAAYGRQLDGVLGYSFLVGKTVLIDYPQRQIAILQRPGDAAAMTASCHTSWRLPLRTLDSYPLIPNFRLGPATGPVTLDTGSNGGVGLFQSALDLPGTRELLSDQGTETHTGARGDVEVPAYAFGGSIGFGPFVLPPGQSVSMHKGENASKERVANVGNKVFDAMGLKVLLDYRRKRMTFFGDCY